MRTVRIIMAALFLAGWATGAVGQEGKPTTAGSIEYSSSSMCRSCHQQIYDQHVQSMHFRSASNPVFLAQYFKELVPRMQNNAELTAEAVGCTACHNPIEFTQKGRYMESPESVQKGLRAVTCDFCHTITGYRDGSPRNGNYTAAPDEQKSGPIRQESWHYRYSRFVKTSEFCGVCHNATNHNGLDVKSTYAEWKSSLYAQQKIECQDCHMNRMGYLTGGKAEYDRGPLVATRMFGKESVQRRIYSHLFPGPHSYTQMDGSVDLTVKTEGDTAVPGQEIVATIYVDNVRAGHKMPTGSAELRVLWLDVRAFTRTAEIPVQIMTDLTAPESQFSISGGAENDWITADVPKGKRVYRAIFVDKSGKPTLAFYDAAKNLYDNRLNAAEVRKEQCRFKVPDSASGPLVIMASLKYLSYPSSFALRLELVKARSLEIATANKELTVAPVRKP